MKKRLAQIVVLVLALVMLIACSDQVDSDKESTGNDNVTEDIGGNDNVTEDIGGNDNVIEDNNLAELLIDSTTLIANRIEQPASDGKAIPSPITYFSRTLKPDAVRENLQQLEGVSSSEVPDYLNLLEAFGFHKYAEDLGGVYDTWFLMAEGNTIDPGEYNENCDLIVYHAHGNKGRLKVVICNMDAGYYFADFGHRHDGESVPTYAGQRATDSYILKGNCYRNESDEALSVLSGVKDSSTYCYNKGSYTHSYSSYSGMCTLLVNGSETESYSALLSDFPCSSGSDSDLLIVWHEDGRELLKLRWEKDSFQAGQAYNLHDFIQKASYNSIYVEYQDNRFFNTQSIDVVTVRPLLLDRSGKTESLLYFYVEVGDGEGGVELTLEGLVAAPFNLTTDSEYSGGDTGTGGASSSGSSNDGWTRPKDYGDCMFCHGDGDCTTCNGYGEIKRYAGAGDYVKTLCDDCRGSGNCKKCGGTGRRD